MGFKIVSKDYLSDSTVITCIQTVNRNNTRSKFQPEQTYGLSQVVWSMEQEENKHKTSSTGKVKY